MRKKRIKHETTKLRKCSKFGYEHCFNFCQCNIYDGEFCRCPFSIEKFENGHIYVYCKCPVVVLKLF